MSNYQSIYTQLQKLSLMAQSEKSPQFRSIIKQDIKGHRIHKRFAKRAPEMKEAITNPCAALWEKVMDCYVKTEFEPGTCGKQIKEFDVCTQLHGGVKERQQLKSRQRFHVRQLQREQTTLMKNPSGIKF
eukprot:TRINITY_DN9926_c0_g1_i1.p1 TRINITY_DN9926_c0_g1~~TRINITY_DN9926_c0_g1_i1.p1  ORF type:complete len:145 (+),score=30.17 TRINITY_DN9926_c0_g1_i1:46-435(+)